tara:strand:- start:339 stop:578 length:240 start_codon:yes stop_codon:yes gene_type:complete
MDNATKYIKSAYAHNLNAETLTLINEGVDEALKDATWDHENDIDAMQNDIDDLKRENSNYMDDIDALREEILILKSKLP